MSNNEYYLKNRAKIIARSKKRYEENKELRRKQIIEWRKRNPDKVRASLERRKDKIKKKAREYYYKNKDRVRENRKRRKSEIKAYMENYYPEYAEQNRGKLNALKKRYKLKKKKATPQWLSVVQIKEIEQFYVQAAIKTKETGTLHHVDHIIPIQGKEVCGLHVPWNLQILQAPENRQKSNRLLTSF